MRNHINFLFILGTFFLLSNCEPILTEKQPNIIYGGRAISVAVSPSDDNKMVVASETGGLFRTDDTGNTWKHISSTLSFYFTDVKILHTSPEILIAGAKNDMREVSGGGLYKSGDMGNSWTKASINFIANPCANSSAVYCIAFDETTNRIWAGTDCGLIYSEDLGNTWEQITSLSNSKIHSIAFANNNDLVVLANNSVWISVDGGSTFTAKNVGLPYHRFARQHNQLAVSKANKNHLYLAINFWSLSDEKWFNGMFYSTDFGNEWKKALEYKFINRPPFVALSAQSVNDTFNTQEIYYGSGGGGFVRSMINLSPDFYFGAWENLNVDHSDASSLAFSNDETTALLLTSDGGVHTTSDGGKSWKIPNIGKNKFDALQITEVVGQITSVDGKDDLYFGTQDNWMWSSEDYGVIWNGICCEGFYLTMPRRTLPEPINIHTHVNCAPCNNYKSKPFFRDYSNWNNPIRHYNAPSFIKPGHYVQYTYSSDSTETILTKTKNVGVDWENTIVNIQESILNFPLTIFDIHNGKESVYLVIEKDGSFDDKPNRGLLRISNFETNSPIVSEVEGFGNIGTFPTMFAWYQVFGIHPKYPQIILVPDVENNVVMKTNDGGINWNEDTLLTNLVTDNGNFKFSDGIFSQISSFGFNPDCSAQILVGTRQSGVFESRDYGETWKKIEGSENIPNIGSFYFTGGEEVVISSYGRGLWKYKYKCFDKQFDMPKYDFVDGPNIWVNPLLINLRSLRLGTEQQDYRFLLIREGGQIVDYDIDESSNKISKVYIDKGKLISLDETGSPSEVNVEVVVGVVSEEHFSKNNDGISYYLENNNSVKGIMHRNGEFMGLLLSDNEITTNQIPKMQTKKPIVKLNRGNDRGITTDELKDVRIIGLNLDPKAEVEIFLDGEQIDFDSREYFNDKDVFEYPIPINLKIGIYKIGIKHVSENGSYEKIICLRVTVSDERGE